MLFSKFIFCLILFFVLSSSFDTIYLDANKSIKGNGTLNSPFQKFKSAYDQLLLGASQIKIINDYLFENTSEPIILENLPQIIKFSSFGSEKKFILEFNDNSFISLKNSTLYIENLQIKADRLSLFSLFSLTSANLYLLQCDFTSQKLNNIPLFLLELSILSIENNIFSNLSISADFFTLKSNSTLILINTNFVSLNHTSCFFLSSSKGKALKIQNITIQSSTFNGLCTNTIQKAIFNLDSDLSINNLTILNNTFNEIPFIYLSSNNESTTNKIASFEFIIFNDNFQNIASNQNSLFLSSFSSNYQLSFNQMIVFNNTGISDFISISHSSFEIMVSNTIFQENVWNDNFHFEKTTNITFYNTSCLKNNIKKHLLIDRGGTCFFLKQITNVILNLVIIAESFNNYTTVGIKLINTKIQIINSKFSSNFGFYIKNNDSGCVLFVDSSEPIFIIDSIFLNNSLNSTAAAFDHIGGACIYSFNDYNEIYIFNSTFLENKSRYITNCIYFVGTFFNITGSSFIDNLPLIDLATYDYFNSPSFKAIFFFIKRILEIAGGYGGVFRLKAANIFISNCIFTNNQAYIGGVGYLSRNSQIKTSNILITHSNFYINVAGPTSGVFLLDYFSELEAEISFCNFTGNKGNNGGSIATNYVSYSTNVLIKNNIFYNNICDYGCGIWFNHRGGKVIIMDSIFDLNCNPSHPMGSGTAFASAGYKTTKIFSIRNLFQNNTSFGGGIFAAFNSDITDINSTYYKNYATICVFGGFVQASTMNISGSKIYNSFSGHLGGAICAYDGSEIYIENTIFYNNSSPNFGGAILVQEKTKLTVSNSYFFSNFAAGASVLFGFDLFDVYILFDNCTFEQNYGSTTMMDLYDSSILFLNCVFLNNTNPSIALIRSVLQIKNLIVNVSICKTIDLGCFINSDQNSSLIISGLKVLNLYAQKTDPGAIYLLDSLLFIENSTFVNCSSLGLGSCIFSSSSFINISQSSFLNSKESCIYANEGGLVLYKTNISDSLGKFSSIYIVHSRQITIDKCNFFNNFGASIGGAIYLENSDQVIIRDTNFNDNNAIENGGAIFLLNQFIVISNCFFFNNSANNGGAIFYQTSDYNSGNLILNNIISQNNTAENEGGYIKSTFNLPISNNSVTLSGNQALYGNDYASYPIRIAFKILQKEKIVFDSSINQSLFYFQNISSGQDFTQTLTLTLLDQMSQVTTSISDSDFKIEIFDSMDLETLNSIKEKSSMNFEYNLANKSQIKLFGLLNPKLKQGKSSISYLKVNVLPSSSFALIISCPKITQFYESLIEKENISLGANEIKIKNNYYLMFPINVRQCIVGEIFISTLSICKKCNEGEFSFNVSDFRCQKCLPYSMCLGGTEISVFKGYWRSSQNSTNIYDCLDNFENCMGGLNSNCAYGYTGILCSICIYNENMKKFKISDNTCFECPSLALNIIIILVIVFCVGLFLVFLIKNYLKGANENLIHSFKKNKKNISIKMPDESKFLGVAFKILLNYIQMIAIVVSFDMKWPFYARSYFTFQSGVGSLQTQIFSLDCLVKENHLTMETPYLKILVAVITPFFILFLNSIYWLISHLIFNKKNSFNMFFFTSVIIQFFLQPTVLKELTNPLFCSNIDEKLYMSKAMNVSCEDSIYQAWKYTYIFPILLYWIIIYPFFCLIILVKNRNRLNNPNIKFRLGFFFIGYKENLYYWEFVIIYRKIFTIGISLINESIIFTKGALVLFLNFFSLLYQIYKKPFVDSKLNYLEELSIKVSVLTIFGGLIYITAAFGDVIQAIIFIGVVLMNIYFFLTWIILVFSFLWKKIAKKNILKNWLLLFKKNWRKNISRICTMFGKLDSNKNKKKRVKCSNFQSLAIILKKK